MTEQDDINARNAAFRDLARRQGADVSGDVVVGKNKKGYPTYTYGTRTADGRGVTVMFDTGTRPDGTYNVYLNDNPKKSAIITPSDMNGYDLLILESGKTLHIDIPAQPAAAPANPAKNTTPQSRPAAEQPAAPPAANKNVGEYRLAVIRDEADPKKPKQETGTIAIIDPQNQIVGEYKYMSGPWHNGHAPCIASYILDTSGGPSGRANPDKDIRRFEISPGKHQDGLRISDRSFDNCETAADRHRTGILIHEDKPPPGTSGCFGIQGEENWNDFAKSWKAIPTENRPDKMNEMSREDFAKLKATQKQKEKSKEQTLRMEAQDIPSVERPDLTTELANALAAHLNPSHAVELERRVLSTANPKSPGRGRDFT